MPDASQDKTWTIKGLINWAANYLKEREVTAPRLSAELMLARVLDCTRVDLYLRFDQPLSPQELARFKELIIRRRAREPLAYILGQREFYGLELLVGPGVLVPRPETEHLVEEGLKLLAESDAPKVLDLCTGSGAAALAIAANHPTARVVGTDLSETALGFARSNAKRLELSERVKWLAGDLWQPVAAMGGFFDMILANPPYVTEDEWQGLSVEVKDFEPASALLGGADGLDVIRQIMAGAGAFLRPQGWLLLEMGRGQAPAAASLAEQTRIFERIYFVKDLSGIDRVFVGQRGDYG